MGKPVVISILGDAKGLNGTLDSSGGRLSKFGRVAKIGLLGVGAGLAVATGAAFKLASAAAEDQQSAMLMAKQFRNSAKATDAQVAATERWISKQGIAKGVADDDLRPALSNLVTATHDVRKAQDLASLAMDISAAKNLSLVSVSKQLAKAQATGNVSALSKLGVSMKDADGNALSLAAAQKRLGEAFGGAATTKAKTFSGMIQRGKIMVSEFGESIGYKLLPPLTEAGTFLFTKGIPAVAKFGGELKQRLTPTVNRIGVGFKRVVPYIVSMGDSFIKNVVPGITRFAGVVVANVVPVVTGLVNLFVSKVIPTVGSVVGFISGSLVPALVQLGTQIGGSLQPVVSSLSSVFQNNILPTVSTLVDKFNEARPSLEKVALVMLKVTGTSLRISAAILGKVLPPVLRLTGFVIGKLVPALASIIVVAVKVIAKVVAFAGALVDAGRKAVNFAGTVVSKITGIPKAVGDVGGKLLSIGKDLIGGLIKGIRDKAGEVISTIKNEIVDKLPGFVKKALGIHSPSRVFAKIGQNIVQGLNVGIRNERPTIARTMQAISTDISTFSSGVTITPKVRADFAGTASLRNGVGSVVIEINVDAPLRTDRAELGRELAEALKDYIGIKGTKVNFK